MTAKLTAEREACNDLFAAFPLALHSGAPDSPVICSMILILPGGPQFAVLSYEDGSKGPVYRLRPWGGGEGSVTITEDLITTAVPFPRDGSLWGWVDGGHAGAMIAFYGTPCLEPAWSSMPDVDLGEENWPPFTGERLIGPWLWKYVHAGRIVDLAPLIAGTPDVTYWVDTTATLGSGCVAVARDLASPDGWILPRGRYVYYGHHGGAPSLDDLLADPGKTDLAPRFRES